MRVFIYIKCNHMFGLPWCTHRRSLWLYLTLCDPMNCSPLGSPVYGIFQGKTPEWVPMPFSRGSSWHRVVPCLLRLLHRWQILYHSATRWLNSKESACNARDQVQYLCQADPMEKEIALQYSCLGNPMDRGAWQTTVHGAARVRHNLETKQQ